MFVTEIQEKCGRGKGNGGSGKSTLLRILATLDTPDDGELYIRGERVNGWKESQLAAFRRKNIGFIYQDYNLFPEYTAYENIIMPIHLDGRTENQDEIMNLVKIIRKMCALGGAILTNVTKEVSLEVEGVWTT